MWNALPGVRAELQNLSSQRREPTEGGKASTWRNSTAAPPAVGPLPWQESTCPACLSRRWPGAPASGSGGCSPRDAAWWAPTGPGTRGRTRCCCISRTLWAVCPPPTDMRRPTEIWFTATSGLSSARSAGTPGRLGTGWHSSREPPRPSLLPSRCWR